MTTTNYSQFYDWYYVPARTTITSTISVPKEEKVRPHFYKQDYKALKELFPEVRFTVIEGYCTIGFKLASTEYDCRMIQVAVSYCSEEDDFRKKTGRYQTLLKFSQGQYVQLPLGAYLRDFGEDNVAELLQGAFNV